MTSQQLTLLNLAASKIAQLQSLARRKPLPIDTPSVTKRLGISASTLSRTKRQGLLPYRLTFEGSTVAVDFAYHQKGRDYWTVCIEE